jgi:ferritin-like metal-binding protein YciE
MPIQSPEQLLLHELHGIEDAENEASRVLESRMEEVENPKLQKLLERRLQQGERLMQEVQESLEKLNGQSGGRENKAARGLIQDSERLLQEIEAPEMKEAVLIASVQKLEHYCIAVWGTVKSMALEMGEQDLAKVMQRALDEGYRLDKELTKLAESRVNPSAMESAAGEEDDDEDEEDEELEDEDEDEDEEEEESGSERAQKSEGLQKKSAGVSQKAGSRKQAKGKGGGADLK